MAARRMDQDRRNEDFRGMRARMEREGHLRRVANTSSVCHIHGVCGHAPNRGLCVAGVDIGNPHTWVPCWCRSRRCP